MLRLSAKDELLIVDLVSGDMAPHHENQLNFWDFSLQKGGKRFEARPNNLAELAGKISDYFNKHELEHEIETSLVTQLERLQDKREAFLHAKEHGRKFKEGSFKATDASEFHAFLKEDISRTLKVHQIKSALHLLAVENGANFSAPGSGKTTVVLTVFELLRKKSLIDALFVVGPPACFDPWCNEYEEVLGRPPARVTLAGGDIDVRHSNYLVNRNNVCDLYLTSFQTLLHDWELVRTLFSCQGIRFYLVIDEAHYIKLIDGNWANAVLHITEFAERRCILTGTPFPKNYTDAFNLFDFLWPDSPPISTKDKRRISTHVDRKEFKQASEVLNNSIGPLFYRVRKSDLNLAPQMFHPPVLVPMNEHERRIYHSILDKIKIASQQDYFRDLDMVLRLRRGRMIRLRQCLSYVKLLTTALEDYDEKLFEDDRSIVSLIHKYDELEKPGKISGLVEIVRGLMDQGEKVVIWSNFVKTLKLIKRTVNELGFPAHLIYGETPLEQANNNTDDITRARIIKEFISKESGIDVLVANPAACAESISLHKTCSNAIYYDLSYNCAQYLQSLDRIHRVGGSEDKPSYYHFLQYEQSLDQDILENIRNKAERMKLIIDQDYPIYSLDMFETDDEHAAYERLFTVESERVQ